MPKPAQPLGWDDASKGDPKSGGATDKGNHQILGGKNSQKISGSHLTSAIISKWMKMKLVISNLSIALPRIITVVGRRHVDFSSTMVHICSLGNFGVFSLRKNASLTVQP